MDTPPSVGELLDVDREYRDKAAVGQLPRIAPRRFNPSGESWLPHGHIVARLEAIGGDAIALNRV
jgi:hypothetical protein